MERWRPFALTALLSLLFLAGLYATAEMGRVRLEQASEDMHAAMARRILVAELRLEVAEAALASRSLLLTGRDVYLQPLRNASRDISARAEALATAYERAEPSVAETAQQLRYLAGIQSGAMMSLVALYSTQGPEAARALAQAQAPAVDPIRQFLAVAQKLERYEAARVADARRHWLDEQTLVRRLGLAGVAVNVLLVLSASLLVLAALRRHREGLQQIARRRDELEVEATAKTAELHEVYGHLQTVQEQERSRLARGLHDELGGLLLAARMDVTWIRQHARDAEPRALDARIDRLLDVLDQGIDLKRRVVEELRPTLLDNMGLLAAIRWQLDETCRRAGLHCACRFPATEPAIASRPAIVVFRVVQEALTNVHKHAAATRVEVTLEVVDDHVLLTIVDDGRGIGAGEVGKPKSHGLAGMKHRIASLGGTLTVGRSPEAGTEVRVVVPRGRPENGVAAAKASGTDAGNGTAAGRAARG